MKDTSSNLPLQNERSHPVQTGSGGRSQVNLRQSKDILLDFGPPRPLGMVMGVAVLVVTFLIALGSCVSYPEIVPLSLTLHAEHDFLWVRHSRGGRIERVFASDNKLVRAGAPLLLLESDAVFEDILKLEETLNDAGKKQPANLPAQLQLGSLQPFYLAYRRSVMRLPESRQHASPVRRVYFRLREELLKWKSEYVVSAPVDGQIAMTRDWVPMEVIEPGTPLMAIAKPGSSIYAAGFIGEATIARIQPEQLVRIELNSYAAGRFGTIAGRIESISNVHSTAGYLVRVRFPNAFVTETGFHPIFRHEMTAQGNVLVAEVSLLRKLLKQFDALDRRSQDRAAVAGEVKP